MEFQTDLVNRSIDAFVTGGSRGIGQAVCTRFLQEGYDVLSPSRSELDLANLEAVSAYLETRQDIYPDVVVINAGVNNPETLNELSFENWKNTLNVNLNSTFLLVQEFCRRMASRTGGKIVVVSSCYSIKTRQGRAAYSASKAALNALVRSFAVEFAASSILINAVAPGFVLTELTQKNNDEDGIKRLESQIPLGRLAKPSEIAELIWFLTSERNTYITGQLLPIDGGFLCL